MDFRHEFLKYAPGYARQEAEAAIRKVVELQAQGVLRDGVYYLVLVDLVGSTKFAAEKGNNALGRRIKLFVTASFEAFNESHVRNVGLFLKEIGDSVLFVFQHFPDIVRWRNQLDIRLSLLSPNEPLIIRTCVHVGEVSLQGVNPLSLAVSQVFKMEKAVPASSVVLTEVAYHVAWPTLPRAHHAFEQCGEVMLDGYSAPVELFELHFSDVQE